MFNGASNIVQKAGAAVLSGKGRKETQKLIDYYMENAVIIRRGLSDIGLKVYGGTNAPYIWTKTPGGLDSWEFFDKLIGEAGVVGTPGSGFGSQGEGFFRLSAFGMRDDVLEAVDRIHKRLNV